MNQAQSSIAPHILGLAIFLSLGWGFYLVFTIYKWIKAREKRRNDEERRKGDVVASFRQMLVAICVFSLPFSLVFRTAAVLAGVGDATVGQIAFFALVGPNVVGSIFAVVTGLDEWRELRRTR